VFCVVLWCMDEYWYYSLMTLAMLMLFESTVTHTRLRTLADMRKLVTPMQAVLVHRMGRWERVEGHRLVPGDVVSVGRPLGSVDADCAVPADLLLLSGSCIVNEAVLTGESTPQWKVRTPTLSAPHTLHSQVYLSTRWWIFL
jgi:cation-transporting ATPase 13A1